ncbi:MAG TPA: hypothetical protein VF543_09395 [Pyrinomonadaceae bacterium]|jgi:heme/copper-type cytochrome/quinol oxidase subunit 2
MRSRVKKSFLLTLGALLFSAAQAASAFAQCAMCKASVQAGANSSVNPQALANSLNFAVLVLLIPPVLIFSALFIVLLRYRRNTDDGGAHRLMTANVPD